MDTLYLDSIGSKAKVAGYEGEIVGEDVAGMYWETVLMLAGLSPFIARCSSGEELDVVGPEGAFKALARRWWIKPDPSGLIVRLLLERQYKF
ncbi:MAG: hypothetical protein KF813_09060 [Trueperaceae bacterium]|nr:hypothetical protein [Trueperaceae bacterium]